MTTYQKTLAVVYALTLLAGAVVLALDLYVWRAGA